MAPLDNHLEQISLSASAIAELPFPPARIFTNALLRSSDITALIRDTELHERALFTLALPDQSQDTIDGASQSTIFHGRKSRGDIFANGTGLHQHPRPNLAVTRLLGGDLGEKLQQEGTLDGGKRGEIDVALLLKGAERLCGVYPIAHAKERISKSRSRFDHLTSSISRYESRVSKQTEQLTRMNRPIELNDDDEESVDNKANISEDQDSAFSKDIGFPVTAEDIRKEEEAIRDLEIKKRTLEDRVSGMERDLGGLLR